MSTDQSPNQPNTIKKVFQLYPQQKEFLLSNELFRAFTGGIGSGKSHIGAYDMIRRSKPGRLYMVVAPTYTLLADATFRSLESIGRNLELIAENGVARGAMPHIKLRNGAEILFRSGDHPEFLRGPNLSGVWMDEAGLMKEEVFSILIGRLRQAGELGWLTATFTPKGKAHWTYKRFATGKPNTFLISARTQENPFLPLYFMETRRSQYSKREADQELDGAFLDDAGNWFSPGMWPRYADIGNAWAIKVSATTRKTYYKHDCWIRIGFDLALNKVKNTALAKSKRLTEDTTDFNAFVVDALTPDGNMFILDCVNERIRPDAKAIVLGQLCRKWRPNVVCGDDDMIAESLALEFRRHKDIPEIRTLPISGRKKADRAMASIIRGEKGLIYLPEDVRSNQWIETFMDAVSSFTGIDDDHDDVPDALGILGRLADEIKGDGRRHPIPEVLTPARDLFACSPY